MWTCPKCKEQNADEFDSCWKCASTIQKPAAEPQKTKRPLEQLEWVCILIAAMPGLLMFTGGRVKNPEQAAFRISVFLVGAAGYIAVKIYQYLRK
jgi:hypothetical protein